MIPAPRIFMRNSPRRVPFELARMRPVIDVFWSAHVAFDAAHRAMTRRWRLGDARSQWHRLRDTRPIEWAGSGTAAPLGDRSADDRPVGTVDAEILHDNDAFRSGSGAYSRGSHGFRRGSGADHSGCDAFRNGIGAGRNGSGACGSGGGAHRNGSNACRSGEEVYGGDQDNERQQREPDGTADDRWNGTHDNPPAASIPA